MRIAYYTNFHSYGGGERYLVDLALQAAQGGHEVHLIVRKQATILPRVQELLASSVQVHLLSVEDGTDLSTWKVMGKLVHLLRQLRPDVFHINECRVGLLSGKVAATKVVGSFHVPERFEVAGVILPNAVDQFLVSMYDGIISVSDHTCKIFYSKFTYRRELKRIYVGQYLSNKLKMNNEIKVVVCPGRLDVAQKGQDLLLEAWAKLDTSGRQLWFLGTGPSQLELEKRCQDLKLNNVTFKGFVNDVMEVLYRADLVVIPSRFEGIPYVILETMSVGTPIVATRVGGIPEAIESGCGMICDPKVESLVEKLEAILQMDSHELQRMSENSRRVLETKFNPSKMFNETQDFYGRFCTH